MCRSRKNRECDNLAELIRITRRGEKGIARVMMEIPKEAKDCHAASGNERMKEIMKKEGKSWDQVANELFYTEGAYLSKAIEIEENVYTKELLELLGIEYKGF